MRYSTIAGAALLTPAVFASPLNARQAGVPTCNPNNIRALGQQKPKSTGFCTNWFKTTTTKHVAPVTVTGLSEAQITNLCSCILAPTYVSGRPLTSLEPTSTQGSTTAAQTSSTTPAITSSVASSTTTSSSASATPTGCVNGDTAAAADGAIYTKYCDSALDGGIGQSFSVGSLANCQAKCTDSTCKGFVYTAASRSCLLYTSVDGPYDNAGSTALVYKSGRGSTSSSSTTTSGASSSTSASSSLSSSTAGSSSSSATSSSVSSSTTSSTTTGPASAPSVFNIFVASSPSATAGGSLLRYPASNVAAGIYPSPTANAAKRQAANACTAAAYAANGNNYQRACDTTFASGTTFLGASATSDDQPDKDDNITTLTGCIDFCSKKGLDANGKQNCKAVSFDPAGLPAAGTTANTACKLYSAVDITKLTNAVTGDAGKSAAYLIGDVTAGIFTLDRNTGYVYNNDTKDGLQLCAFGADTTVDAKVVKANHIINGKLSSGCSPLVCKVDAQLRLTCQYTAGNVIYDKTNLDPDVSINPNDKKAQIQNLKLTTGASSQFSMYIAAPVASTASPAVYSNGNEKALAATTDFVNTRNTTLPVNKVLANSDANGAINATFVLDSDTDSTATPPTSKTATVTLLKDVFVYANDYWRFTASVNLERGRFATGVSCVAQFGFDGVYTASTVTIDKTFPSSYDLLFEGQFGVTKTSTASIVLQCTTTAAITIPVTISNIKLVNNPNAPARANYYTVGDATTARKAYIQFYNGSGTLIPDGTTYGGVASTALTLTSTTVNTGTTTVLYVGQSLSNKPEAIRDCAAKNTAMFELYFDTTDNFWKCVTFTASRASATLFTSPRFPVTAANANPVFGYYQSTVLPYVAN